MGTGERESSEVLAESHYARVTRQGALLVVTVFGAPADRVTSYPETDELVDDAWELYHEATRRGRLGRALNAMAVVAVISGIVWLLVDAVSTTMWVYYIQTHSDLLGGPLALAVQALDGFANGLFLVATSTYGLIWLYRRGMPNARR